ncbi:MAG: hypothetical protein U0Y10_14135 [Spirosomataceae bacterium]
MQLSAKLRWMGRVSLFIIFFWFGFLKVIALSPAEGLVKHLHEVTLASLIPSDQFVVLLGIFECIIGLLWLFPKLTKLAFVAFMLQMFTTFLPLLFLKADTWTHTFVLTLTGQYIVKNLALVALACMISATEKPLHNPKLSVHSQAKPFSIS